MPFRLVARASIPLAALAKGEQIPLFGGPKPQGTPQLTQVQGHIRHTDHGVVAVAPHTRMVVKVPEQPKTREELDARTHSDAAALMNVLKYQGPANVATAWHRTGIDDPPEAGHFGMRRNKAWSHLQQTKQIKHIGYDGGGADVWAHKEWERPEPYSLLVRGKNGDYRVSPSFLKQKLWEKGETEHIKRIDDLLKHGTRYSGEDFDVMSAAHRAAGSPVPDPGPGVKPSIPDHVAPEEMEAARQRAGFKPGEKLDLRTGEKVPAPTTMPPGPVPKLDVEGLGLRPDHGHNIQRLPEHYVAPTTDGKFNHVHNGKAVRQFNDFQDAVSHVSRAHGNSGGVRVWDTHGGRFLTTTDLTPGHAGHKRIVRDPEGIGQYDYGHVRGNGTDEDSAVHDLQHLAAQVHSGKITDAEYGKLKAEAWARVPPHLVEKVSNRLSPLERNTSLPPHADDPVDNPKEGHQLKVGNAAELARIWHNAMAWPKIHPPAFGPHASRWHSYSGIELVTRKNNAGAAALDKAGVGGSHHWGGSYKLRTGGMNDAEVTRLVNHLRRNGWAAHPYHTPD